MFLPRGKPDDVTRTNFLDGSSPALSASAAGRYDQGLAQRMRVPSGPRAGFESDAGAHGPRGSAGLEQGIDPDRAGKPVGRAFARGLRTTSLDIHVGLL